jgi:hypothetical protein
MNARHRPGAHWPRIGSPSSGRVAPPVEPRESVVGLLPALAALAVLMWLVASALP